ncbi:protein NATD1 [Drosophila willistoni]|nr:protein NATD1 [Drosophila willistoni]
MQSIWRTFCRAGIRRSVLLLARQRLHCPNQQPILGSCPNSFLNNQDFLKTPNVVYAQSRCMAKKQYPIIQEKRFFYIEIDGIRADLRYSVKDGTMIFWHTNVPEELGGQGVGKALAKVALDYALRNGLFLVIKCQFVQHYIDKYEPQYAKYLIR